MRFFDGVISVNNITTLLFVVFAVLMTGYALGRITVKGISLGDAGVFIMALLFGALFFGVNETGMLVFDASTKPYDFSEGLKLVESLGLILFVTSVGYIAGPKFFLSVQAALRQQAASDLARCLVTVPLLRSRTDLLQ